MERWPGVTAYTKLINAKVSQVIARTNPRPRFLTDVQLPWRIVFRPAVVVAAHPDDEILGVGTLLPHLHQLRAIVHVTDGAPRRGSDPARAGAKSWQEYAALRRRELQSAMQKAGLRTTRLICLGYPDQETSFHIPRIALRLARLFQRFRARILFTHPYEGGHPDHDACAAAVWLATKLLNSRHGPEILEFSSYHAARAGSFEAERFLGRSRKAWRRSLSKQERQHKLDLLTSYTSQQHVISQCPINAEPVRLAPRYNFRKPPHRGKLYYENFDWGVTGPRWRRLASQAAARLSYL